MRSKTVTTLVEAYVPLSSDREIQGNFRQIMTTLILSLIEQHTPDEINLYILDFGSETLGAFSESPHVGDVMFSHDTEKIKSNYT
ncbi:FtsK/SpoIIIE domain-containing protein [Paenibacillus wynnii]|uniref:FtsK/SpoIIIE domain-containing protein n=1 Tax=Paenibacillus wynnii TaxID=268407 RepID=UPI00278F1463|nr:FtsK/SpoIIIE domain-containing protein [Paenibacillus wynnii]MDQ0194734.1 hypothetical protein [Paenibacillus wynnii]